MFISIFIENGASVKSFTLRNRLRACGSILLFGLFLHSSNALAQDQAIGIVKLVNDHAYILREDKRITCQIGEKLFQHDVLETDDTGSLGVTLKDNTRLSLGPKSRLMLNEFVFNPKQKEYSFITKIIRGTLVYISGVIAKLSPESVSIKTPTATVGIRGTRLVIRIEGDEASTDKEH